MSQLATRLARHARSLLLAAVIVAVTVAGGCAAAPSIAIGDLAAVR